MLAAAVTSVRRPHCKTLLKTEDCAHLKGKVSYAVNDIIEEDNSSSRHQANRAGNQQHCCLWLIIFQSWWLRAFVCSRDTMGSAVCGKPACWKASPQLEEVAQVHCAAEQ